MEPRRLLDDDDGRFELCLLRSARSDEAPPDAKARAAAALGLGAASFATTAAAHGTATAGKLTLTVLANWLGVGFVAGAVVTGGLAALSPARTAKPAGEASAPVRVPAVAASFVVPQRGGTSPEAPVVASASLDSTTAVAVSRRESKALAPSAERDARGAGPPATPRNESIAAELSMLARARRALVARDPAAALSELDAYDAAPRTGVLGVEAGLLRVEAWLQQGDRARAVELARRLIAVDPSGAHAARLRQILEGGP